MVYGLCADGGSGQSVAGYGPCPAAGLYRWRGYAGRRQMTPSAPCARFRYTRYRWSVGP